MDIKKACLLTDVIYLHCVERLFEGFLQKIKYNYMNWLWTLYFALACLFQILNAQLCIVRMLEEEWIERKKKNKDKDADIACVNVDKY
jgi:hypothetical protein